VRFNSRRQRLPTSAASLDPSPDGSVVGWQASLGEKLLDVTIGKQKSQVSPKSTGDHREFEVAPLEQRWP
jgi:hypothetical protein